MKIMSQKIIDTIYIRVCDKYNIKDKYDFDEDITIFLKGNIVKKELKDNQDGSCNLVLHFKALDYKVSKFK